MEKKIHKQAVVETELEFSLFQYERLVVRCHLESTASQVSKQENQALYFTNPRARLSNLRIKAPAN